MFARNRERKNVSFLFFAFSTRSRVTSESYSLVSFDVHSIDKRASRMCVSRMNNRSPPVYNISIRIYFCILLVLPGLSVKHSCIIINVYRRYPMKEVFLSEP